MRLAVGHYVPFLYIPLYTVRARLGTMEVIKVTELLGLLQEGHVSKPMAHWGPGPILPYVGGRGGRVGKGGEFVETVRRTGGTQVGPFYTPLLPDFLFLCSNKIGATAWRSWSFCDIESCKLFSSCLSTCFPTYCNISPCGWDKMFINCLIPLVSSGNMAGVS